MNRDLKTIPVNEREHKYIVKLTGTPCDEKSINSRIELYNMLRQCAATPSLMDCGNNTPESIKIIHDGLQWVLIAEAIGP